MSIIRGFESTSVMLSVETLPAVLAAELKRRLTIENPEYREAVDRGRYSGHLSPEIRYWTQDEDFLRMPRGVRVFVEDLCHKYGLSCVIEDRTRVVDPVDFASSIQLEPAQHAAVDQVLGSTKGVLQAPTGSGKTVCGFAVMAARQQPVLWLTDRKELMRQTMARATQFLGIAVDDIGLFGDGKRRVGERLTIGLLQTLSRGVPDELIQHTGHIVVDEVHHIPARTAAAVVSQFSARYLLGLSATPYRRQSGLTPVIHFHIGPVTAEIRERDIGTRLVKPHVLKRETGIEAHGDTPQAVVTDLVTNRRRTALIASDVVGSARRGRHPIVLTDRVDHAEALATEIQKQGVTVALLHGRMTPKSRASVKVDLDANAVDVLVATTNLGGEGLDFPYLDTLFLATPMSWHGRLKQCVGRICRAAPGKEDAWIIDLCDQNRLCWFQWGNRRRAYEAEGYVVQTMLSASAA